MIASQEPMSKQMVASILHGAYGDVYEQLLCLKHFVTTHPGTVLELFAATPTRLQAFKVLDLSFAASFQLWREIERAPEIASFFQFQVKDSELQEDVLRHLSPEVLAKVDQETNHLPWNYMREHGLIPERDRFRLRLSSDGSREMQAIEDASGLSDAIWSRPTISFLWRYRKGVGAISSFGQKSEQELVAGYSRMFRGLIDQFGCHVIVCGMNVLTDDTNRERTDNKYPAFGLDLPPENVTYMKGLSWPLELEIASRATVACGHTSGFTEGLWLKRGRDVVLMDPQPHYLAKAAYRRMPLFHLNRPSALAQAALQRSPESYGRRIAAMLRRAEQPASARKAA
jgi:hypothetical protein